MRYERKYRIEGLSLAAAKQLLFMHPASFRKLYPGRQVNNIYYDTPELTTFHQNVYGYGIRKKFRVRWYGDSPAEGKKPRFEIKYKHNELGRKDVSKLDRFSLDELETVTKEVNLRSNQMIRLHPVLMNAYRRDYYTTPDRIFRVTIDYDLRYHSLRLSPKFKRYIITDPAIIMEIKYDREHDDRVAELTQHLPFRQSKHSKYVSGVQMTV